MPTAATESVLDTVRAVGLLTPTQAAELTNSDLDAPSLSAELLRRGWITRFQAGRIADGRAKDLALGPYLLLDRLGAGGMGEVFRARHTLMNRVVALKVIREERLAGEGTVARFRREIEAAARLSHPNIVIAHDAAQVGRVHFYVMEHVPGTDLARLVKESGPLPVGLAAEIGRQAALGLQHAHERGLVHRDVKPSNLMLVPGPPPVVKVLDVGLARMADADPAGDLTSVGAVMGTPDYLAPEQSENAHAVDIRADVYALGCTLYHLLAGRPPFPRGSVAQKLLKHREIDPAPLDAVRPDIPIGLASVVQTMMAKRPADRYQTPAGAAAALAPFADPNAPVPSPGADTADLSGALVGTSVSAESERPAVEPVRAEHDSAGRRRWPRIAAAVAFALPLALGLLYSTTIVRVVTNKGELVVEVDDPNIEVVVHQGTAKVVDRTKDRTFVLKAGDEPGLVEFLDPETGARAATREFRIDRGGQSVVRATWKEIADARPKPVAKKDTPAAPDRERQAIEFVLAGGGSFSFDSPTNRFNDGIQVRSVADLPAGPLRPRGVRWNGPHDQATLARLDELPDSVVVVSFSAARATDGAVLNLVGLRLAGRLKTLQLTGTKLTDAAFQPLARLRKLVYLNFQDSAQFTGTGLVHLAGLTELREVSLPSNPKLEGKHLEHLAGLPLTRLDLRNCPRVGDEGIKAVARITTLVTLDLGNNGTTDDGLAQLEKLPNLRYLNMNESTMTDARKKALAAKLPRCKIDWPEVPTDRAAAEALIRAGVRVECTVNGRRVGDEIGAVENLPAGSFLVVHVHAWDQQRLFGARMELLKDLPAMVEFQTGRGATDLDGFRRLATYPAAGKMLHLNIEKSGVTGDWLAELVKFPELREIYLGENPGIDDTVLDHFARLTKLEYLNVRNCPVTDAGMKKLAARIPNCRLIWSGGSLGPGKKN